MCRTSSNGLDERYFMQNPSIPKVLNRFTSLPILLDMLSRKCITLLEPTSWEDRNDAFYLEKYKEAKNLKTLLAYCFSAKRETFHHWKVFSNGASGVCVEFHPEKLLGSVRDLEGIRIEEVDYQYIKKNIKPHQSKWPFLKRKAFEDEGEWRIIYENKKVREKTKDVPFDVSCIQKITLSPWLLKPIDKTIKEIIRSIDGCGAIPVSGSALLESEKWKNCLPE